MATPPDKTEEVLQAINHLLQALKTLQLSSDQVDEARDAKVDAIGNYIDALWAKVESQGNTIGALAKAHEAEVDVIKVLGDGIIDRNSSMDGFDSKLDGIMDGFDAKLDGIRDDIGLVRGGHARNAMRQNLSRIVDHFGFTLISLVPQKSVVAFSKATAADQGIAPSEVESFGNADMVANVLDSEGKPSYLALEASYTVASNDIRRAVRNAGYVNALTGLSAYAAVTGVQVLPEAQAEIDAGQVLFYQIPAREMQSE